MAKNIIIMLKSMLIPCLIFICSSCKNSKKDIIVQNIAKVYFFIEDSSIDLKNKFGIDIYSHDKIINTKIKNDSVFWELPLSDSSDNIRVVFGTGNYKVDINNVPAYFLLQNYKIDLIFGIDHIPFSDEVIFPIKDSNSYKNITDIYYIKTGPLEQGLGRIFRSYK